MNEKSCNFSFVYPSCEKTPFFMITEQKSDFSQDIMMLDP